MISPTRTKRLSTSHGIIIAAALLSLASCAGLKSQPKVPAILRAEEFLTAATPTYRVDFSLLGEEGLPTKEGWVAPLYYGTEGRLIRDGDSLVIKSADFMKLRKNKTIGLGRSVFVRFSVADRSGFSVAILNSGSRWKTPDNRDYRIAAANRDILQPLVGIGPKAEATAKPWSAGKLTRNPEDTYNLLATFSEQGRLSFLLWTDAGGYREFVTDCDVLDFPFDVMFAGQGLMILYDYREYATQPSPASP